EQAPPRQVFIEGREVPGMDCSGLSYPPAILIDIPSVAWRARSNGVCFTLTHELVHQRMSRAWHALPSAVEDGLADWIGFVADPTFKPQRLAEYNSAMAALTKDPDLAAEFLSNLEI